MKKIENYIDGKIISSSKKDIPVFDPSTGEQISSVVLSDINDFNVALESSKNAQIEWSKVTPLKRSRILSNYKVLIEKNIQELAELVSREQENFRRFKGLYYARP